MNGTNGSLERNTWQLISEFTKELSLKKSNFKNRVTGKQFDTNAIIEQIEVCQQELEKLRKLVRKDKPRGRK